MNSSALLALQCMDLTSLQTSDTPTDIARLCEGANSPFGNPAALCVYPELVATARQRLDELELQHVHVATVINFPSGDDSIESVVAATERSLAVGAAEIDLVMPYRRWQSGDNRHCEAMLSMIRSVTLNKARLKVIIESGELAASNLIRSASELVIETGADFIKTSTGKVPINATLEAAHVILDTISKSGRTIGFKAAGGIRTVADAEDYFRLAATIMGDSWVTPTHFRIGASSLLQDVIKVLGGDTCMSDSPADTKKGCY
ncbi:MAG TPA: deoxyribose-phosphate aldolase [Pseudidiomarina sp.]|nr:deoxyribose-phosphate aldolase [Pseudidiomarina sp.]